MTSPIYPTLIGLTYPVVKTPIMSVQKGIAASGREVRIALYANPIWEFTLTYDYLPNKWVTNPNSSDLATLLGFYVSIGGSLSGFQFEDVSDNQVTNGYIGTGDGTTTGFTFSRAIGTSVSGFLYEPVGMVNTSNAVDVYVNGTLKTPGTDYTLTATPVANQVVFTSAPAASAVITATFSFYYWVRFKDDQYDFSQFMQNLWEVKKVVLHSLRG